MGTTIRRAAGVVMGVVALTVMMGTAASAATANEPEGHHHAHFHCKWVEDEGHDSLLAKHCHPEPEGRLHDFVVKGPDGAWRCEHGWPIDDDGLFAVECEEID